MFNFIYLLYSDRTLYALNIIFQYNREHFVVERKYFLVNCVYAIVLRWSMRDHYY